MVVACHGRRESVEKPLVVMALIQAMCVEGMVVATSDADVRRVEKCARLLVHDFLRIAYVCQLQSKEGDDLFEVWTKNRYDFLERFANFQLCDVQRAIREVEEDAFGEGEPVFRLSCENARCESAFNKRCEDMQYVESTVRAIGKYVNKVQRRRVLGRMMGGVGKKVTMTSILPDVDCRVDSDVAILLSCNRHGALTPKALVLHCNCSTKKGALATMVENVRGSKPWQLFSHWARGRELRLHLRWLELVLTPANNVESYLLLPLARFLVSAAREMTEQQ